MVMPMAYAHVGFVDSLGNFFTLIESDTPASKRYYIIPQEYRSSRDSLGKPEIAISLCADLSVPTVLITGFLEPYISPRAITEIKAKFGSDIDLAPLPMYSAGSMLMISGLAESWAITVDDRPDSYDDVPNDLPEAWRQRLKAAAYKWKKFGIRPAIHQLWEDPSNGVGMVYPARTGTNIGAKVPISMLARGRDNVTLIADQIRKGAAVTGQIAYTYKGTIRPYYMFIRCDISKIHEYFSAHFTVGKWFASADVYQAVENLKHTEAIKIEIYDENHAVTTKYNVQQILDKILKYVLEAAFDSDPKVQAEKQSASAQKGERWWWWSGGFAFRGSSAQYSRIFNFELKITGLSDEIPVTTGVKVDTPKLGEIGCDRSYADAIDANFEAEAKAATLIPGVLGTVAIEDSVQQTLAQASKKAEEK